MRNSPEYFIRPETEERIRVLSKEEFRRIGRKAMNCHHLMWTAENHHDFLRAEHDFQPQMYIPAHNEVHNNTNSVPEFSKGILQIVRAEFRPTGDTLKSLDEVLICIDHASKAEHIHPIDRQLAQMSIYALESQIPYLRGNIAPYYDKDKVDSEYYKYVEEIKEHCLPVYDYNYNNYVRGYK